MSGFLDRIVTEVEQKGIAYERWETIREWLKMEGLEFTDWATESDLDCKFGDLPNPRSSKEKFTSMVTFSPLVKPLDIS